MTGNSRWWTLPVVAIDFNHQIDTQQLFAQMADEVRAGKEWWLTQEEERLLDKQNAAHLSASVIRERLMAYLELTRHPKARIEYQAKKAIQVLEILEFEKPTNAQMKECAGVLREILGPHKRQNGFNKWQFPIRMNVPKAEVIPARPTEIDLPAPKPIE